METAVFRNAILLQYVKARYFKDRDSSFLTR
jgi:hypothetical protein